MKILVTGVAGFIGFHAAKSLLSSDKNLVIGIDNINEYYNKNIKSDRLNLLSKSNFKFYKTDISSKNQILKIFKDNRPDYVLHLAGQAGVRFSIDDPYSYISSNILGFLNILESCRFYKIKHLVYASSSSVYGFNENSLFSESDRVDSQTNIYAVSKKTNESMSYAYAHLFQVPTTGLRFFTVYGPWGRPDMAYYKFVKNIILDKPIDVYGYGKMFRDFTYIDDVIWAIKKVLVKPPKFTKLNLSKKHLPWQIFNVGNNRPIELDRFIDIIENYLNKKAIKNYSSIRPGEVEVTAASISKLREYCGYEPVTPIEVGLPNFINWFKNYHS